MLHEHARGGVGYELLVLSKAAADCIASLVAEMDTWLPTPVLGHKHAQIACGQAAAQAGAARE